MTDLFTTMSDTTKQIAEMNSGSYRFEPLSKTETTEEESESSLYKLLDHSAEDLFELALCIQGRLLMLHDDENRKESFDRCSALLKVVESALAERQTRDSEAWAEQTVKEIKEAVK